MPTVLIVDRSAILREGLSRLLAGRGMTVQAAVADVTLGEARLRRHVPDVLVLDPEWPRGEGLRFIRRVRRQHPDTAIVLCTSTPADPLPEEADALIVRPADHPKAFLEEHGARIAAQIRACLHRQHGDATGTTAVHLVAAGISTGGVEALGHLLPALPSTVPGLVIVQHMPAPFTGTLARRLDDLCRVEVREAADGDSIRPGRALLAPGGQQMEVVQDGAHYRTRVWRGPRVNRHCPSVDVLFHSVAATAGARAVGVIMTGMGDDGARGLRAMHDAGACTLAQSAESCMVYGMPQKAIALGGVTQVLPLDGIARCIAVLRCDRLAP